MKKNVLSLFISLLSVLSLSSCDFFDMPGKTSSERISSSNVSISSSEEEIDDEPLVNEFDLDYNSLKERYGNSFVLRKGSNILEAENGIYYIDVDSKNKTTYTASGYLEGKIVIRNSSNFSNYYSVKIILDNACIISNSGPCIEYSLDKKNLEISVKNGTFNHLVNTDTSGIGHGLYSRNDTEITTSGTLDIYTKLGHGIYSSSDIILSGGSTINMSVGHDGIHTDYLSTSNYSGTINISHASSQGIDCTNSDRTGHMNLTSGTFNINDCESVLKADRIINLSNCNITSTGIWKNPVAKNAKYITLSLNVDETCNFIVNGNKITSGSI